MLITMTILFIEKNMLDGFLVVLKFISEVLQILLNGAGLVLDAPFICLESEVPP